MKLARGRQLRERLFMVAVASMIVWGIHELASFAFGPQARSVGQFSEHLVSTWLNIEDEFAAKGIAAAALMLVIPGALLAILVIAVRKTGTEVFFRKLWGYTLLGMATLAVAWLIRHAGEGGSSELEDPACHNYGHPIGIECR